MFSSAISRFVRGEVTIGASFSFAWSLCSPNNSEKVFQEDQTFNSQLLPDGC